MKKHIKSHPLSTTILISTEFLSPNEFQIKNVTELKTELLCSAIKAKAERGIERESTNFINQHVS